MESLYEKSFKGLKKIHAQTLPGLENTYRTSYMAAVKEHVINHEPLNAARSITYSAYKHRDAYSSAGHKSVNISRLIESLIHHEQKIKNGAYRLNDLLEENKRWFAQVCKKYMQRHAELFSLLKKGNTPGEELLGQVIQLGRDIVKTNNEEIPQKKAEVYALIKKIEQENVEAVLKTWSDLQKLDRDEVMVLSHPGWHHAPEELLFYPHGAFTYESTY